MQLDVVCSPTELPAAFRDTPGAACAVIDVVRATTTLVVLAERQAGRICVVEGLQIARDLAASHPGIVLVGERDGVVPAGFDVDNAPDQVAAMDLAGRTIVLSTTNGTRTIAAAKALGASAVLIACLRNASAVAQCILRGPGEGAFALVCAGRGDRVALDDLYTAGLIVRQAWRLAQAQSIALTLTETAQMALQLAITAGPPLHVLQRSQAGLAVISKGRGADLAWCAAIDATDLVPVVTTGADGTLELEW